MRSEGGDGVQGGRHGALHQPPGGHVSARAGGDVRGGGPPPPGVSHRPREEVLHTQERQEEPPAAAGAAPGPGSEHPTPREGPGEGGEVPAGAPHHLPLSACHEARQLREGVRGV